MHLLFARFVARFLFEQGLAPRKDFLFYAMVKFTVR